MATNFTNKYFERSLTPKQISDSGMAFVLILLLITVFTKNFAYCKFSLIALVLNMTYPKIFYPFAYLWLGISKLMGAFMSKIILSIVFFSIVLPIGLIRKIFKIDSLNLLQFKKSEKSVFKDKNHTYTVADIEYPY